MRREVWWASAGPLWIWHYLQELPPLPQCLPCREASPGPSALSRLKSLWVTFLCFSFLAVTWVIACKASLSLGQGWVTCLALSHQWCICSCWVENLGKDASQLYSTLQLRKALESLFIFDRSCLYEHKGKIQMQRALWLCVFWVTLWCLSQFR